RVVDGEHSRVVEGRLQEGTVSHDRGPYRREGPPHVGDDLDELQGLLDCGEPSHEDEVVGASGWLPVVRPIHASGDGGDGSDAALDQEALGLGTADNHEIELARDGKGESLEEGG